MSAGDAVLVGLVVAFGLTSVVLFALLIIMSKEVVRLRGKQRELAKNIVFLLKSDNQPRALRLCELIAEDTAA